MIGGGGQSFFQDFSAEKCFDFLPLKVVVVKTWLGFLHASCFFNENHHLGCMKVLLFSMFLAATSLGAQNVGINATGSAPHPSAGLDIDFQDRGVLIPRLTEAQRNAIVSPAAGLLIFNTTTQCMNLFNGSGWRQSCFECPFQLVAGSVPTTCEGGTINLTANTLPGATYQWTGPNGFTSTNQNPSISSAGVAAGGLYNVTATVAGCTSSAQNVSVTISPKPAQPTATSNGPVPLGNSLQLTASNVVGATYAWIGPNGFTSTQQNPTIPNFQVVNQGTYKVVAIVSGCSSDTGTVTVTVPPYQVFTSNGTFTVPAGVTSIRVCVVGGGGGGGGGHSGGGGSGHVRTGTYAVSPGQNYTITVGTGGTGGPNGGGSGTSGGSSSISGILTASGGNGAGNSTSGGSGGSGGGGGCNSGNPGPSGGTNGASGGSCTYSGGSGGNFNSLALFSGGLAITAGAGGAGGTTSHSGGGGGGGVQIAGFSVNGSDGVNSGSAKGGRGFGGGGGGGGYAGPYYQGGNGAAGVVYIEW